jgi:hypothetical protein
MSIVGKDFLSLPLLERVKVPPPLQPPNHRYRKLPPVGGGGLKLIAYRNLMSKLRMNEDIGLPHSLLRLHGDVIN